MVLQVCQGPCDNLAWARLAVPLQRRTQLQLALRKRGDYLGHLPTPDPADPLFVNRPAFREFSTGHRCGEHVRQRMDEIEDRGERRKMQTPNRPVVFRAVADERLAFRLEEAQSHAAVASSGPKSGQRTRDPTKRFSSTSGGSYTRRFSAKVSTPISGSAVSFAASSLGSACFFSSRASLRMRVGSTNCSGISGHGSLAETSLCIVINRPILSSRQCLPRRPSSASVASSASTCAPLRSKICTRPPSQPTTASVSAVTPAGAFLRSGNGNA